MNQSRSPEAYEGRESYKSANRQPADLIGVPKTSNNLIYLVVLRSFLCEANTTHSIEVLWVPESIEVLLNVMLSHVQSCSVYEKLIAVEITLARCGQAP